AARQHEGGAGLVQEFGDADVVDAHLAGAAAAARAVSAGLADAPAKGLDMNLVLVLVVAGLALDALQLQKHVDCHGTILLKSNELSFMLVRGGLAMDSGLRSQTR